MTRVTLLAQAGLGRASGWGELCPIVISCFPQFPSLLWPLTWGGFVFSIHLEESRIWGQLQTRGPGVGVGAAFHGPWLITELVGHQP